MIEIYSYIANSCIHWYLNSTWLNCTRPSGSCSSNQISFKYSGCTHSYVGMYISYFLLRFSYNIETNSNIQIICWKEMIAKGWEPLVLELQLQKIQENSKTGWKLWNSVTVFYYTVRRSGKNFSSEKVIWRLRVSSAGTWTLKNSEEIHKELKDLKLFQNAVTHKGYPRKRFKCGGAIF